MRLHDAAEPVELMRGGPLEGIATGRELGVMLAAGKSIGGVRVASAPLQNVTETAVAEEALNRARSELAHVARVSTMSALTASIAHEVNQPLHHQRQHLLADAGRRAPGPGRRARDHEVPMMETRALVSVVDDDESVRESLPDLLNVCGYRVEAFSSPKRSSRRGSWAARGA